MKKKTMYIIGGVLVLAAIGSVLPDTKSKEPNEPAQTETVEKEETQAESEVLKELNCNPHDVNDDVTGKWKVCTVTTSMAPEEYAADYYDKYIAENDDEIHGIVNFTNNTTTKISKLGNQIDVTTYEYQDGEEHSAKDLYSGMLLTEYTIDPKTKNIERIQ